LELNSKTYDANARRFIGKPVLSFLLPENDTKECLLAGIREGLKTFKSSVQEYVINVLMRHEIALRQINIQTIPMKQASRLIRRAWFRRALVRGPVRSRERGIKRTIEMVVDRPPRDRFYGLVDRIADELRSDYIERWKGVRVKPYEERLDRRGARKWYEDEKEPLERFYRLRFGPRVWRFVWPKELRDFLVDKGVFGLITLSEEECHSEWLTDHPGLHPLFLHTFLPQPRYFRQPPELDFLSQFPLGYR